MLLEPLNITFPVGGRGYHKSGPRADRVHRCFWKIFCILVEVMCGVWIFPLNSGFHVLWINLTPSKSALLRWFVFVTLPKQLGSKKVQVLMVNMSEFLPYFAVFKTVQPGLCPSVLGLEVPQCSGEGAGSFGLKHLVFSSINLEKSFPVLFSCC